MDKQKQKSKTKTAGERVSEQTARARKELALAELRELELAEKQGELVKRDDVRRKWLEIAGLLDKALDSLPAAAAPAVAVARDARHAQTILTQAVADVRRQVGGEIARLA